MIKSIAFHILKGVQGKSTCTGNIGYCISKHNKKVIIVDADIQANLTSWFVKDSPAIEVTDVLYGEVEPKEAIIQVRDNLYILPTKGKNSKIKLYGESQLIQEPFVFSDLNDELNKLGFDYAIYDLAPSISQLERCVLLSCNEVITPITPEYFSFNGIELFYSELQKINKSYKKNVRYNKIVVNMINDSFITHKQYTELLSNVKSYTIYKIKQDRKIADSQKNYQTIFEYCPKSQSVSELERITKDLLEGWG